MTGLPLATWARLALWLGIGLAIYLLFGRRNAARMRASSAVDTLGSA